VVGVKRGAMMESGISLVLVTDKVIINFFFIYRWDSAE